MIFDQPTTHHIRVHDKRGSPMSSEMIDPIDYIVGIFKAVFPGLDDFTGSLEKVFGS